MASPDKEVEEQLLETGNKIAEPPASAEELLPLLDTIEKLLAKVEQSPSKSMQNAVTPSVKALVSDQLLRHSDVDVKVAVAACISEITRITAPDAPYSDEQMKEVFHLIVSSFENLSDKSSRSYGKRASILETVAKVRSCVVMLDLECDTLIIEMFQHFLKTVRDYHPESVFSSMETIMSLVFEESEDISVELLSPVLASVKRDDEDILPIARKLGERVLNNCSKKLKPYLVQAVKSLGISFDDYSDVVSSICKEPTGSPEPNNHDAGESAVAESKSAKTSGDEVDEGKPTEVATPERVDVAVEERHDSVKSNGIVQGDEDGSLVKSESEKDEDHGEERKLVKSPKDSEPASLNSEKVSSAKGKPEKVTKKRGRKPNQSLKSTELSESSHVDTKNEPENEPQHESHDEEPPSSRGGQSENLPSENEVDLKPSSPKATDIESGNVASPSQSGSPPEECNSNKIGQTKRKDNSAREETSSADDVSKKLSERMSDSETKLNKDAEEKDPAGISDDNKTVATEDAMGRGSDTTSDNEAKTLKQSARKADGTSKSSSGSLKQSEVKRRQGSGKSASGKTMKKLSGDDDKKETISSPKPTTKATKDEKILDKTTKTTKGEKVVNKTPNTTKDEKISDKTPKTTKNEKISDKTPKTTKDEKILDKTPKTTKDEKILDKTPKTTKDEKILDKTPKTTKDEKISDKTSKTSSKRKRTPGKGSETKNFDESLIGSKIKVWWPIDRMFYEGVIGDYDPAKNRHKVLYTDGDEEILNLKKQRWQFVDDDSGSEQEQTADPASPESAPDIPQKKKAKLQANESAKRGKIDGSPKKLGGGVTSSSKSKGAATKSDGISGSKVEGKSKENPSKPGRPATVSGSKSKDQVSKTGGKIGDSTPKTSSKSKNDDSDSHKTGKSKDDETSTPAATTSAKPKQDSQKNVRSKQGTPKTPMITKGKSPKVGDKSNSNVSAKVKFTSSKSKGGDSKNSAPTKTAENSKGKSQNSSNDPGSEAKTGKKRRRETKG